MSPERFRMLLQSHGADLRRWPEADRRAAAALTPSERAELQQAVADAVQLDGWLDSHDVAEPGALLMQRIVAGAEIATPAKAALPRPIAAWPQRASALAAIGLVGSLAGSLAGAMAVSLALRGTAPPSVDWLERSTAFSGLLADGSEE
jgi:hypothetical protein